MTSRYATIATVLALLWAACAAFGQSLTGVETRKVGDGLEVAIRGNGLAKPKTLSVMGGTSYIVEFGANLGCKQALTKVGHAGVEFVQVAWFKASPPTVRVHIKVAKGTVAKLIHTDKGYVVQVNVKPTAKPAAHEPEVINNTADDKAAFVAALSTLQGEKAAPAPTKTAPAPTKTAPALTKTTPILTKTTTIMAKVPDGDQTEGTPVEPKKPAPQPKKPAPGPKKATQKAQKTDIVPDRLPPLEPYHPVRAAEEETVSLEFAKTGVVQIIKALAIQAHANIIVSPDVSPEEKPLKITVSLKSVTVTEALDLVTSLADLRYAKVGNSYIVARSSRFSEIMTQLAPRDNRRNVIRVVPITCGDGNQVKQVLAHWFGPTTLEVLTPSDASKSGASSSEPAAAGDKGGGANPAAQPPTAPTPAASAPTAPAAEGMDTCIFLIGRSDLVDQAERLAIQIDAQIVQAKLDNKQANELIKDQESRIAEANAANASSRNQPTQIVYEVQNGSAMALKAALVADGSFKDVKLIASPEKSTRQAIVVTGTPRLVESALQVMKSLDIGHTSAASVHVYDVKYLDPRALREDLVFQVPGLSVVIPPASAGTPRLYTPGSQGASHQVVQEGGAEATGNNKGNSGPEATTTGVKAETGLSEGLGQPFQDMEKSAYPMKLFLRGSKEQIEQALSYLAIVDVPPKQVAIELRVMELTKEDAAKFGIDWNILTGGAVSAITFNQAQDTAGSNSATGRISGNNWSSTVTGTLDLIANKNNLIARPNMLAMDGRESEIFIGDVIRYVQSRQSSQSGVTVVTGEVPVGVRLSVLPRIGGGDSLTMDIRPVVSFLKEMTPTGDGGYMPQTSLRIGQSTVNILSGETIAIGGLIQDQDQHNVSKVPLLAELPLLGQLFRKTTKDIKRTELVIFLTAKIVDMSNRGNAASPRESLKKLPDPVKDYLKGGKQ